MNHLLSSLLILALPGHLLSEELLSEQDQSKASMAILDAWQQKEAEPGERFLHIVCWTPADRELPANYKARLTRIMKHIQSFYENEMEHHGFGKRSFNLQSDKDDNVVIHAVRGKHPTAHYSKKSGGKIRQECLPFLSKAGIDAGAETIVLFCNLADWDAKKLRFSHKSPYYAGGTYRSGTAWQLDSPELDTTNLKLKSPMIQDGEYGRISLGKHNSIFIGGIAHELGHALSLPHCRPRPDERVRGTPLMGAGNRTYGDELREEGKGTFLTFAHALRLASHPQFSGSIKGLSAAVRSAVTDVSIQAKGKAIEVSGTISGSPPVYGVVAYFDPEGNSDYNASTATAIPDASGKFALRTDALPRGKRGELRLIPLHANGSTGGHWSRSRLRYSYRISKDGTPDLSAIQTRLALSPILKALADGEETQARQLAGKLPAGKAASIAERLTTPVKPTQTPAEYDGKQSSMTLTSFKPTSIKVGWSTPTFDRLPDASVLLESDGQIFETGIYAHAPAHHKYALGGSWETFKGKAGLATGHSGTVVFEIKGDGKTLWKSKTLSSGRIVDFEVEVQGIKQLVLITHTTSDGPGNDWGLWLTPALSRKQP